MLKIKNRKQKILTVRNIKDKKNVKQKQNK